jgi:predicted TIM-barrel fold metal-dependent hydrolase
VSRTPSFAAAALAAAAWAAQAGCEGPSRPDVGHYLNRPAEFLEFVLTRQIPPRAVERSLRTKVVFGSNYPRIEIRKMAAALGTLGLSPGCLRLIFEENARRLLHLDDE